MFKNILNTFSTKLLLQVINFGLIILTAKVLGPEGRGEISFFVANMTLIVLFNNLIGGSAIVYLTPRANFWKLLIPSYGWAAIGSFSAAYVLLLTGKVNTDWYFHLVIISFLSTLWSTNLFVIQGKELISKHNYLALLQVLFLAISWLLMYYGLKITTAYSFIYALYFSLGLSFIWSFIELIKLGERLSFGALFDELKPLVRYGFLAQVSNIIMFFSYRLTYYFLDSNSDLGVYSVAVQISEAVWIIGKSLAMVQFSRISNALNQNYKVKLTLRLMKTGTVLTFAAVAVLLCIPSEFYEWLIGDSFGPIAQLLRFLAPGIVSIAMISSITPFYGGTGRYGENIAAAMVGVIITLLGCYVLIPELGIFGAAMSTSVAYVGITLFLLLRFHSHTKFKWQELILRTSDMKSFFKFLKRF